MDLFASSLYLNKTYTFSPPPSDIVTFLCQTVLIKLAQYRLHVSIINNIYCTDETE